MSILDYPTCAKHMSRFVKSPRIQEAGIELHRKEVLDVHEANHRQQLTHANLQKSELILNIDCNKQQLQSRIQDLPNYPQQLPLFMADAKFLSETKEIQEEVIAKFIEKRERELLEQLKEKYNIPAVAPADGAADELLSSAVIAKDPLTHDAALLLNSESATRQKFIEFQSSFVAGLKNGNLKTTSLTSRSMAASKIIMTNEQYEEENAKMETEIAELKITRAEQESRVKLLEEKLEEEKLRLKKAQKYCKEVQLRVERTKNDIKRVVSQNK
ncbi:hypothetical protein SS50377_22241 [Spironucleus salmonicida]|uniref:Uncharacterized protein n=1 Tax=Spironucleus salmonicida TaxID=348837 RepID=V6LCT9_9EUKA|nr:hypothetical protein SS50377_22241 [Spironucleus salmonicida]|eukprot:EST42267.1 Hypothetical protein SS50377_18567 [Spironucleus salmonicida]